MKDPATQNDECRMCDQREETIDHLIGGCTIRAPKRDTDRHNEVAKILHLKFYERYDILIEEACYYKYSAERESYTLPTARSFGIGKY